MKISYTLLLTLVAIGITALLSGCGGSSSHTVYSSYGYPYYGHGVGYNRAYYNNNYDNRRGRRVEKVNNMSPAQRQHTSKSVQARRTSSSARNMGRPRTGGRRR